MGLWRILLHRLDYPDLWKDLLKIGTDCSDFQGLGRLQDRDDDCQKQRVPLRS